MKTLRGVVFGTFIILFVSLLLPSLSFSGEATLFERTFVRGKGSPVTEKASFNVPSPAQSYTIQVVNGNLDGTKRCSSAEIVVNGIAIFGPSDFNQQVPSLSKSLALNLSNILEVTLKCVPDSFLVIKITGSEAVPPIIRVLFPTEGQIFSGSDVTVSGTIDDSVAKITINGIALLSADGVFQGSTTLAYGANTIEALATDFYGNSAKYSVNVVMDNVEPVIVLDPTPEYVANKTIEIKGRVEDLTATMVTIQGKPVLSGAEVTASIPAGGGSFSITVDLSEGLNNLALTAKDSAGNTSESFRAITLDIVAPEVVGFSLKADPKVTLVIPISITFTEAVDPSTVNLSNITICRGALQCALMIDGSFSVSGPEIIFTPSSDFPANQLFTLSVGPGVKDRAGNSVSPAFTATFDTIRGPAFILGEVYDDTLGLPLERAEVRMLRIGNAAPDPIPVLTTDAMGRFGYEYQGAVGEALVEVGKSGYTKAIRIASLSPNKSFPVVDVRLTPVKTQTVSASAGGNVISGDTILSIPPLSLVQDSEISLTPLSPQGTAFRLPLGWSPFYGLDVSPWGLALQKPASLSIKNVWSLTPLQIQGGVVVAYFDENTLGWTKADASLSGGDIVIEVKKPGQYLLLVPDTFPSPPPIPTVAGGPILPSVNTPADGGTATVAVVPPAVLSQKGAQGLTTVVVTTEKAVPSGTTIEAKITERYNLRSGEAITTEPFFQDITLYAWPPTEKSNTLSASFPTTPSQIYPLGSLSYGEVNIEIYLPTSVEKPIENVIGEDGGTITGPDGTAIIIPPASLTAGTAFRLYPLSESDLPVGESDDFSFMGGLVLQMAGGEFTPGLFPQFYIPGLSVPDGTKVIMVKVEAVNGKAEPLAAAIAVVTSGKLSIERCLSPASYPSFPQSSGGNPLPCISNGQYAFYVPSKPISFITGTALKASSPASGVLVLVNNLPFKAVTDITGSFALVSLAGDFVVKAMDAQTNEEATASGMLGEGETKSVTLHLASKSLEVISVIPHDKETGVDLKGQIKVAFSREVDPATVNADSFIILQKPALISDPPIIVTGRISLTSQNIVAVFTPDAELKSNRIYYVKLTSAIKDTPGNALVPFESVFTTAEVLDNSALPPQALKVSMPDAEGFVVVKGGVGLTYGGAPVVIINKTKNIVLTVIANGDGSFEGKIKADLTDEIVVQVMDLLGNTTTISPGLFQNDDGTAAVGQKGGTIYGPGGVRAIVPEGAFDEAVVVKVTMGSEEDVKNVSMDPEMRTLGVIHLESSGAASKKEIKVSFPAPEWITPEHQILITKVVNVRGFDELTLACPAVLKDDQVVSTSPPFAGMNFNWPYYLDYVVRTWADTTKGVCYALVETWSTDIVNGAESGLFIMGWASLISPIRTLEIQSFPITVPVNEPFNVTLQNLDGPVQTISIQGPPRRGEFVEGVIKLTNDTIPPTVFTSSIPDGATGVLLGDNITIEMSELVNSDTVNCNPACGTVVVKDTEGNIIEGSVYLAADGKTIVFTPKYGYEYGTTYTISIDGVKDLGDNEITAYSSNFETFKPQVLATIDVPGARALDKVKNSLIVAGAYSDDGTVTGIRIIDVSDPQNPVKKGFNFTAGYEFDVEALPDVTFTDHFGTVTSGDFAVVVGGQASRIGYLNLVNVTDQETPYNYEWLYLSWSPLFTDSAPLNVPYATGTPYGVALLDTYAYVVNLGLGIQAIDLAKVTPPQNKAQHEAILSTYWDPSEDVPSFRRIASLKSRNLLLTASNHTLSILGPTMNVIGKITDLHLPFDVTGVEAFPIDADGDGNLGEFEDNDGDPTTSKDETFDLAFVSTQDGVVIIDVTKPEAPCKTAIIPTGGLPGNIRVDKERRLAYVMLNSGLGVMSLKDLKPSADCMPLAVMIDVNKDEKDDRIISVIPEAAGGSFVLRDDNSLAYVLSQTEGVKVVSLGQGITVIDDNDSKVDEIKFGDGGKPEKRYKVKFQSASSTVCSTLKGKIRTRNAKGVIDRIGANYYPPEYELAFEESNGKCVIKLNDNGVKKEKFIVLNMSREAFNERLLELWELYKIAPDFSKIAILYGGIGNKIEVEINAVKTIKKEAPIEPVGVIVIGIDGLRQDVLYAPGEASYSDPTGCGGSSCYLPLMEETLPGLLQILKPEGALKLKDVTAIFPSITFASWASIFTGKLPGETGIMGNEYFARDLYASNTTFEGLRGFPPGMITYSDGAFKVGCGYTGIRKPFDQACFYSKHIIPADWYDDSYKVNAIPRLTLQAKTVYEEVASLVKGYQVSPHSGSKCDASQYECRSVVAYNHYAKGADRWRTMSSRAKSGWDYLNGGESYLMDSTPAGEAADFIVSYFSSKTSDGKRKRFPALFTVYFAGLDHEAHGDEKGGGMSAYKNFFMNTTDKKVGEVVNKLKEVDEFYNKIFIVTADHGHTAMPTNLSYRDKNWLGVEVDRPAEMSCKLKLDFGDPEKPNAITREQLAELNNNNLHIWELGEVFKAVGKFTRGAFSYRVLAPESISALFSEEAYGTRATLPDANVVATFNGPMAHIYVTDRADLGKVAEIFKLTMQGEYVAEALNRFGVTQKGYKDLRSTVGRLKYSIDKILVRNNGNYCVFDSMSADGSAMCASTDPFATQEYVQAWLRINGMNHPDRSGDIVLLMKDSTSGSALDRYTTGVACKSWHGSLSSSDSYVPFIVSYPGGNKREMEIILQKDTLCKTDYSNCKGNWKLSDVVKGIISEQYK